MANEIDIFSIQPSVISRDLKGKYILLYGAPKVGKTSFAVQAPRALVCAFEVGTNALSGVNVQKIRKWLDFKRVLTQLRQPKGREYYDTVVIDTISIAASLCEKYICQQNDVETLKDIPWGGGWGLLKTELQEAFREITMMGYGLIFIAHEKKVATKEVDAEGQPIMGVKPDITNSVYNIVNSIVDIIGYIAVEDYDPVTLMGTRYLYTRQTPLIFAGSRYQYLEPKIEFGYEQLVNAIGDAIDKSIQYDGAKTGDTFTPEKEEEHRPFSEVMDEARAHFERITNGSNPNVDSDMEKVIKAITYYFGSPDFRLSETQESQQDLLEAVVEEMRKI